MQESNKFYFRVDSSSEIGFGHISRTKTLAEKIKSYGNHITFLSLEKPGAFRLSEFEHKFFSTEQEITSFLSTAENGKLIIDHYQIDEVHETTLRPYAQKILVIDDLANRKHNCDILLDHNLHLNLETRYNSLVNESTKLLLGPQYCILSDHFQNRSIKKRERLNRILVFFGGGDHLNQTKKYFQMMVKHTELVWDIVVGLSNEDADQIEKECHNQLHINFHKQINYMDKLMIGADLFFGAGGYTSLERTALGLPGLIISTAENQISPTEGLANKDTCIYLGHHDQISINDVENALNHLTNENLFEMSENCLSIIDGRGVSRILKFIL